MHKISGDEILKNINLINEKYYKILSYLSKTNLNIVPRPLAYSNKVGLIFFETYNKILKEPEKFLQINLDYMQKFHNLMNVSFGNFVGEKDSKEEAKTFKKSTYFELIQEIYKLSSEFINSYKNECFSSDSLKTYVDFHTKQLLSALSPKNFIFANPKLLEETMESNWENIVKGLDNFLEDLKKSKEIFTIATSNNAFFKKGKNIAATKGKVVFQNKLMQLICYKPTSSTYSNPILLVPPWINKYYILDLSEHNSLVKFLINNNFQVFIISWINPGSKHKNLDFEDYLKLGILDATDYIQTLGFAKINTLGYCIGGTLLACALAYFKTKNEDFICSATFLTTLLDFENSGEIGEYISEENIVSLEQEMNAKGYLDGRYLSNIFSLLRSGDLVWSFFINNYLRGKNPPLFDILYWNSDYTNLPAKMHGYYLRNMYLNNNLKRPGKLNMLGVPINLNLIEIPSFFVSTSTDHIAPWQSVYKSMLCFNKNQNFILGGSGHIAGIINPPISNKYYYKINKELASNPSDWLLNSQEFQGSWWSYWSDWLKTHSGLKKPSLNYSNIEFIEKAPGKYCG